MIVESEMLDSLNRRYGDAESNENLFPGNFA